VFFECVTCNRAFDVAPADRQHENHNASVGRHAWGEIEYVHHTPLKFIGELLPAVVHFQIYQMKLVANDKRPDREFRQRP
jgi:hypothetical protein